MTNYIASIRNLFLSEKNTRLSYFFAFKETAQKPKKKRLFQHKTSQFLIQRNISKGNLTHKRFDIRTLLPKE